MMTGGLLMDGTRNGKAGGASPFSAMQSNFVVC